VCGVGGSVLSRRGVGRGGGASVVYQGGIVAASETSQHLMATCGCMRDTRPTS
jgi:hypothetical protein